jgi:hypothetical protein
MKYVIVLAALMSGCATVSEYNRGCRDGISNFDAFNDIKVVDERVNNYCDILEKLKDNEKRVERQMNRN